MIFLFCLNTVTIKPKQQINNTTDNTTSTAIAMTLPVASLSSDSADRINYLTIEPQLKSPRFKSFKILQTFEGFLTPLHNYSLLLHYYVLVYLMIIQTLQLVKSKNHTSYCLQKHLTT